MCKGGVIPKINRLLKVEKNKEIFLTAVRVIGEISKASDERVSNKYQLFNYSNLSM
jgi:hypothetical protein